MEFFYDHKQDEWKNVPNKEKRFAIHLFGVVIPMGDFYEAWATFRQSHHSEKLNDNNLDHPLFTFHNGYIPMINDGLFSAMYDMTTNKWESSFSVANVQVSTLSAIFQSVAVSLHNRVERLEGLFDTIRQRSSIIDEFIKIGEEVITKQ